MIEHNGHAVGDLVAGRFALLARLGGSGTRTVWKARDLAAERDIALKELRPSAPAGPGPTDLARQRVLREARALARIGHANLATVHDVLNHRPHPWLVMELVAGQSLRDVVDHCPLSPAAAAHVGLDVLAALRSSHAAGVLHRDVEPGNVLIRPDGSAVLTGFRIAALAALAGPTEPGRAPGHVAPEELDGGAAGPASDLWSLGLLLRVCVRGHHPERRTPPPRADRLAPVIDALLARDPAQRLNETRLARLLHDVIAAEADRRI
ncbi:serine/threonine-protein kinase [Kitasatospora sp. NPDC004669]|uniref:serine/threonine-protein kinase n=1 Tax=Kitasatospora sp. NPDC004669 TaxID=3154555 RepID=UPI0033B0D4D0